MRCLPYVDDFLCLASTRTEALRCRDRMEYVLDRLGLRRHPDKGRRRRSSRRTRGPSHSIEPLFCLVCVMGLNYAVLWCDGTVREGFPRVRPVLCYKRAQ